MARFGVQKTPEKELVINVKPPITGAETVKVPVDITPKFLSFLGADNPNIRPEDLSHLIAKHDDVNGVIDCLQARGAMVVNVLVNSKYHCLGFIKTAEDLNAKLEEMRI